MSDELSHLTMRFSNNLLEIGDVVNRHNAVVTKAKDKCDCASEMTKLGNSQMVTQPYHFTILWYVVHRVQKLRG